MTDASRVCLVAALVVISACSGSSEPRATDPPTSTASPRATSTSTHPTSTEPAPASTSTSTTLGLTTTTHDDGPLSGKTVVVDPGHNGMNWAHLDEISQLVDIGNGEKACNTTGTSTASGYTEAEFTWSVATLVVPLLEAEDAKVILTRSDNDGWGPCVDERAAIGNRNGADAVISIHADGGPDDGRGFHVIHPADTAGLTDDIYQDSLSLAVALHDAYLETSMPIADYIGQGGYSERDDLGGLNLSDVPSVFLEAGNMRNGEDAGLLSDEGFQQTIARAIVEAVTEFLSS